MPPRVLPLFADGNRYVHSARNKPGDPSGAEGESAEERARQQYHDLIAAYGAALAAKEPCAQERFVEATAAWEHLRTFRCEEAELDADMHLVAAFSFAIQAHDIVEARRVYEAMSEKYQKLADGAETIEPGSLKSGCRGSSQHGGSGR
jgi:hypothetical protein